MTVGAKHRFFPRRSQRRLEESAPVVTSAAAPIHGPAGGPNVREETEHPMNDTHTDHQSLFIDGAWRQPHSTTRATVLSANTEEPIGSVPDPDDVDIDRAVAAARRAFDDPTGWSHWTPSERAAVLHAFADAFDKRSSRIAELVSDQNGMPISISAAAEAYLPSYVLRYYADIVADAPTQETRTSSMGGRTLVEREPIGVVAAVVPWNFPNILAVLKYAPALAAGCTVVLKPALETALDAALVADAALEAGFPPGVLNIVAGGRAAGAHLVRHPDVNAVSFTGSTAAGVDVGAACGPLLRPVSLELGGKSAAVVLDDADLDSHLPQLAEALFGNNGQTCFASSRVLAPRGRYGEVVESLAALARSFTVGNSLDPATHIGPLVSARQRARVEAYIAGGVPAGARLIVGGGRPAGQERGWFVEPTVFADVSPSSALFREEIFGPVVTVTPYLDDADAIRLANDSEYGLGGTVWTSDPARGLAVARSIDTGTVGINGYSADIHSPMAAVKSSGLGFKLGPEALQFYQRFRATYL